MPIIRQFEFGLVVFIYSGPFHLLEYELNEAISFLTVSFSLLNDSFSVEAIK